MNQHFKYVEHLGTNCNIKSILIGFWMLSLRKSLSIIWKLDLWSHIQIMTWELVQFRASLAAVWDTACIVHAVIFYTPVTQACHSLPSQGHVVCTYDIWRSCFAHISIIYRDMILLYFFFLRPSIFPCRNNGIHRSF